MNKPRSNKKSFPKGIIRFFIGTVLGLFVATVFWSASVYFQIHLTPAYTVTSILIIAITFGAIATRSGIDKLMDSINNLPPI